MKVQTKIVLLLAVVFSTFLAGLAAFRSWDRIKIRSIAEQQFNDRNKSFDEYLKHQSVPLETLTKEYSNHTPLVEAIARNNTRWFEQDLDMTRLDGFQTNAAWVYRTDGTKVYSVNNLNYPELAELPIPPAAFEKVFNKEGRCHFFVTVRESTMEIRGGKIHPSGDFARATTPAGFFFAGKLWNKSRLEEMGFYTGNEVTLVPPERAGENYNDESKGTMAFSPLTLSGWDQRPLAKLVVRNESPIVRELSSSSERLLLWLILFAFVLLLLLTSSLVRWVSRPLRQIMETLKRNDPAPIARLSKHNSEFGELARTVQKFFEQRDNLFREMEERRSTAEALRKSEEELRHSQKMEAVGRLAGGVAHDFNNLLTAIIGYAELIATRETNDSLAKQHADLIRKAGEQAATLTRQLLAFSRKQLLQPRVIDLNHLVVDMEKLLRRVIGERYDLQTVADAELGTVMADPSQIEQVILNLGVNARDAMPTGGRLTIRTANVHLDRWQAPQISVSLAEGDYVELSVTDTGAGMDDATKTRIFEPFFTTKGPGKGTGLGLATVYGIVRQTGGGISVESELGRGSTFRIYLPLERSPVDLAKPVVEPIERSSSFETVLVVEDEEIVRELVCDILAEQGYNVMCAVDGHEALRIAGEYDGRIHLLITDVIMPHMNGPELAATLTPLRPDMKVLFVSGYSDNDIGEHGVLDTHIDLLQKPFTPQTLARKIRDVIEERSDAQTAPV
jgi:signal transduction histidine kinase/ActR/RegA family two-component response regulator